MTRIQLRVLRAVLCALCVQAVVVSDSSAQAAPDTSALGRARAAWEHTPENADSIIWYGRRVGYTGDYAAAVAIFAEGVRLHPEDARMYRHRGHRYLSLRDFAAARADLEKARELVRGRVDEVEPDGQPNARGIPTSTLQSNIRYHLALTYFLQGDLPAAGALWEEDAKLATNLDQRVASTYWWVICAAQLGQLDVARAALAPIRRDWDIIENGSYHRLLLHFRGDIPEDSVLPRRPSALELQTIGNGIAQWHLAMNRRAQAVTVLRSVLETGPSASFGFVAVETTAKRLGIIPSP
jgi:tetratricopeptide (TPR) repeat protein